MRKNKKILLFILVAISVLIIAPSVASAVQTGASGIDNPLCPKGKDCPLPVLIGRIIKAALGVVGSLALLMLTYGGFLWMTSGGSEKNITKGKQVIVWAVIGLVVIFLSYAMVDFVIKGLTKGAPSSGGSPASTQTTGE